jgi:hypothetical protein
MTRPILALALMAGATFATLPASASPIVHDTAAEFSTISYVVGFKGDGSAVDASRRTIGNMFDNSLTSITSLGRATNPTNASISFEIAPATGRYITGGQVVELTGGTSGFPERANIFLGNDLTGWVQIGTMSNGHVPNTAGWSNVNNAIVSVSYVAGGSPAGTNPTFNFTVISGFYDSVRIVDIAVSSTTPANQIDGFDIAEFEVTSEAQPVVTVPEPFGLGLFGLGVAGLTALRRRRAAAPGPATRPHC